MPRERDFFGNKQIFKNCEFVFSLYLASFSELAGGTLTKQICVLQNICKSWLLGRLNVFIAWKCTQDSKHPGGADFGCREPPVFVEEI